jgi:hypothetical protein
MGDSVAAMHRARRTVHMSVFAVACKANRHECNNYWGKVVLRPQSVGQDPMGRDGMIL